MSELLKGIAHHFEVYGDTPSRIDLTTIKEGAILDRMPTVKTKGAGTGRLTGKTKAAPSESEGWTYVGTKRKQATIPHEISPVWCGYESELWNLYFETLTGKNIGFEITPHSFPYFSPLECRRNLDRLLQTLFSKRPIVLDLTCGSGSDSIAFLMHLDPEQIFCVDDMSDEDFAVACENMQKYVNAFPETYGKMKIMKNGASREIWKQRISMHKQQASDFIRRFAVYLKTISGWENKEILGYFDPAWDARYLPGLTDEEKRDVLNDTGDNVEYEVSPKILFNYIQNHILKPMLAGGIQFSVFCIKVRWEMTPAKMQKYLDINPEVGQHFVVLYSVQALPFVKSSELGEEGGRLILRDKRGGRRKRHADGAVKGQFHWIVMKNTNYTYSQDVRSWWYKQWIEHKSTPVYVEEASQVKPHKPLYESVLPYPTVSRVEGDGYKQMGPPTSISIVQERDIEYFTRELESIKTAWAWSSDNAADLIEKVKSLVDGCEIYMNTNRWRTESAENLRKIVGEINTLIQEYGDGPTSSGPSAAGVVTRQKIDLGELLQQLQNLKWALL